jgi:hypothetical protein
MRTVFCLLLFAWPLLPAQSLGGSDDDETLWSLRPLATPAVPSAVNDGSAAIDAFIERRLEAEGLAMSPAVQKRDWLRRVHFDLVGLPPSPTELANFLADSSDQAKSKVVDQLLASPRYGERWARHWMDVVRYAETHGHDEDAIRENAWPYRDWLIEALNRDLPYADFVAAQVAGDMIFPDDPKAVAATGFLACGPWDASSQMGIQDGTTDKKIAQYLDRDDMLSATLSTFTSLTVNCARCHDHKSDPIPTTDYYALQAVFAGIDKVDRPFDSDPVLTAKRQHLTARKVALENGKVPADLESDTAVHARFSDWLGKLTASVGSWETLAPSRVVAESGSKFEHLGDGSVLFTGEAPETDRYTLSGTTRLKKITALRLEVLSDESLPVKGPGRAPNGNLHLSEITIHIDGRPVSIVRAVADHDQPGWEIGKSFDGQPKTAWGIHPLEGVSHQAVFVFSESVLVEKTATVEVVLEQVHGGSHIIGRPRLSLSDQENADLGVSLPDELSRLAAVPGEMRTAEQTRKLLVAFLLQENTADIAALPEMPKVFGVSSVFDRKGNFMPAGIPRIVHVLDRGDVLSPLAEAEAGALSCLPELAHHFELEDPDDEGQRRAALARWLSDHDNVLTWRSIVNRVWHYHFGRGIVATPNDLGSMGAAPTHPDLLDWLAVEFRDRGGSLKWLHRQIVLSRTYAQSASDQPGAIAVDADNRLLWRMNRRRLDAESIRDAVLAISGKLDLTMGGPSARQFHSSKGVHVTPKLDYEGFDPDDPANFRRSVYRFVFRTVPDPLMSTLDCPDASQLAPKRETSATALQALAMLNNRFLVRQSEHIAARLEQKHTDPAAQIDELFLRAYGRSPAADELGQMSAFAREHGLANTCRVVINSSEFLHLH